MSQNDFDFLDRSQEATSIFSTKVSKLDELRQEIQQRKERGEEALPEEFTTKMAEALLHDQMVGLVDEKGHPCPPAPSFELEVDVTDVPNEQLFGLEFKPEIFSCKAWRITGRNIVTPPFCVFTFGNNQGFTCSYCMFSQKFFLDCPHIASVRAKVPLQVPPKYFNADKDYNVRRLLVAVTFEKILEKELRAMIRLILIETGRYTEFEEFLIGSKKSDVPFGFATRFLAGFRALSKPDQKHLECTLFNRLSEISLVQLSFCNDLLFQDSVQKICYATESMNQLLKERVYKEKEEVQEPVLEKIVEELVEDSSEEKGGCITPDLCSSKADEEPRGVPDQSYEDEKSKYEDPLTSDRKKFTDEEIYTANYVARVINDED